MTEKKYRIPRKIKKKIPVGHYCYTIDYDRNKIEPIDGYWVKTCPFFKHIKLKDKPLNKQDDIDLEYPEEFCGWCTLEKWEVDDQCKCCGSRIQYSIKDILRNIGKKSNRK
jgi:hypothetical protein